MKNSLILAFLALSVLGLNSCKKDNNNGNNNGGNLPTANLDFGYEDWSNIPATATQIYDFAPVGLYMEPYSGAFESNTDQHLADKGYTKEQVVNIKCQLLNVEITNNPGQTLDFMDTIKIYVDSANGSGANRILLAYKYNYPTGLRSLDLDLSDVDVKDVFRADSVKMTFGGTKRNGGGTIMANTELHFTTNMRAVVQP